MGFWGSCCSQIQVEIHAMVYTSISMDEPGWHMPGRTTLGARTFPSGMGKCHEAQEKDANITMLLDLQ